MEAEERVVKRAVRLMGLRLHPDKLLICEGVRKEKVDGYAKRWKEVKMVSEALNWKEVFMRSTVDPNLAETYEDWKILLRWEDGPFLEV